MKPIEFNTEEATYLYDALENCYALVDTNTTSFHDNIRSRVQGKILSKHHEIYERVNDIRKHRWHKENVFDKDTLFLGGGLYSMNAVGMLHKRLAYATMILGGKQQNGGQGTEFDEQSDKEDEQLIKTALKDIIAAFGYKPEEL